MLRQSCIIRTATRPPMSRVFRDHDTSIPSQESLESIEANEIQAFRFFDLPFELRTKILRLSLVTDHVYCLDPQNFRAGSHRLKIFLTSRRMHEEASRVFYGGHTFRMFPTHGRFFGSKTVPLIARLPTQYRHSLISLELRLGIGWTAPPRSWTVTDGLGLEQMRRVRVLKILVECDPSLDVFRGFRISRVFYSEYSRRLLEGILQRLPAVSRVEIDSWPSVPTRGHLITTLMNVITGAGLTATVESQRELPSREKEMEMKVLPRVDTGFMG